MDSGRNDGPWRRLRHMSRAADVIGLGPGLLRRARPSRRHAAPAP